MTDAEYTLWNDVIEELRGTAGHYIPEELEDDARFLEYLDQHIFLCESCGWWCERSEEAQKKANWGSCTDCCPDDDSD